MIPLSCKETVEFTDEDGIIWKFKPVTGTREEVYGRDYADPIDRVTAWVALFADVFISVSDPQKRFDPDSLDLNFSEKAKVLSYWLEAGRISAQEKKA